MEALKEFVIEELLKRQAMLDKKFDEKETVRERNPIRIYIAYFTELGELAQELKSEWNYWKNSTKKINREKVLEELSDVLHFYLSYTNQKIIRNTGYGNWKFQRRYFPDIEMAMVYLTRIKVESENRIIGAMMSIVKHIGATEEEFLQIHHQVWLRNMNERTKGEY